jgi:hypothetical protein
MNNNIGAWLVQKAGWLRERAGTLGQRVGLRELGPYTAAVLMQPGGSVMALVLWVYSLTKAHHGARFHAH